MSQLVRLNSPSRLLQGRRDLVNAAAYGIADVLRIQGIEPRVSMGIGKTADFLANLERKNYNYDRNQLNVKNYAIDLVNQSDIGSKTPDFILTDVDIYADNTNFVYGVTWASIQLSIQSVARVIKEIPHRGLQQGVVQHIARHEFAHMRGLNESIDYTNPDRRGGIYNGHCANICTMHQVQNMKEGLTLYQELAKTPSKSAGFCDDCHIALLAKASQ